MNGKRQAARAATVTGAGALLCLVLGGTALAAAGTDGGLLDPAPAATALLPVAAPIPTPTPSPTGDPVTTVTGAVDTALATLGLAKEPTSSPSPTPSPTVSQGPTGTGSDDAVDPTAGGTTTPVTLPQPHHKPAALPRSGNAAGAPLGALGAGFGDRRPELLGVGGPVQGAVRGIGSIPIAVAPLPSSARNTLGDNDGAGESSLPGLLVVCAAACVAAVAAGNAEVWRRRLADTLS
jgi:hypothetical protein